MALLRRAASRNTPLLDLTREEWERNRRHADLHRDLLEIKTLNWFLPHPRGAFGGILTPLRFAAHFAQAQGVQNRFVFWSPAADTRPLKEILRLFPALQQQEILVVAGPKDLSRIPEADASVATFWKTAYLVAQFHRTQRKFYFIQDLEPLFYPAGSQSAQVEATYRLGFLGIASTPYLREIYETRYQGRCASFTPCVDTQTFHPLAQERATPPFTVLFYGRPQIARNAFELGAESLQKLKAHLGRQVRIVSAGEEWPPRDHGLSGVLDNLGAVDQKTWASLCRSADAGLIMIFTPVHPYVHLDLMASGCLVVSNDNPGTRWLLKDGENCLLFPIGTPSCIFETLLQALTDAPERARRVSNALKDIQRSHSSWEREGERIYRYLCAPFHPSS